MSEPRGVDAITTDLRKYAQHHHRADLLNEAADKIDALTEIVESYFNTSKDLAQNLLEALDLHEFPELEAQLHKLARRPSTPEAAA